MRTALLLMTACMGACLPVCAQLCTGSLGDPVVHITFGSGGTQGNAVPAASTTYGFRSSDCPDDGWYTIRTSTNSCFGSTWHSVAEDHTPGDNNGYMMIVNASFQPGVFYLDTVRGLCANTTYEFAAWIMNVLRTTACGGDGIDPILIFQVETTTGDTLMTYSTQRIMESATPTWIHYGHFFTTTAASTSVVLRISNNAPGGCGNDILMDDITFRPCGPEVNASLSITGDTLAELCEGNPANFLLQSASSAGYSDPVFQWQVSVDSGAYQDIAGATMAEYLRTSTSAGLYRYRLSVAERNNIVYNACRVASNTVTITVDSLPLPGLPDTSEGCEKTSLVLGAAGGVNYDWTGPNGFTGTGQEITIDKLQPADAGAYHVLVTTDKGCSAPDTTQVVVYPAVAPQVSGGTAVCEGQPVQLNASGGVKYEWTPATGLSSPNIADPVAMPADTTEYKVTIYNEYGCSDTALTTINIWKKPRAMAGPDKRMREGKTVPLEGIAEGTQVHYFWTPATWLNDASSLTPQAGPPANTTYTLHVVSDLGCGVSTDDAFVRVYKEVKVPNAFSPNGDGINDDWQITNLITYPEAIVQVFNRNGQLVYQSRGYGRAWNGTYNGKPLPVGTYYYVIDLKTDYFQRLTGWVFIVR
jgi:gliding motility-associated-like protein